MKFRRALSRRDRLSLAGMAGLIVLLHIVGFGLLLAWVVPKHLPIGGEHPVFTVGVGMLAYTFGVRHGFDADHIAAVDNTIRKLLADRAAASNERTGGRPRPRPLSVGFWFSLGHSTIVFLLAVLLAAGVKQLIGAATNDASVLHTVTGTIGPAVSGLFLWILGGLNLITLLGILRVFRQMRAGRCDETELQRQLNNRGLMNRFLGGLAGAVRKPWHIYPIGLLFGLGFDTATEVGLLVLAGGAAALSLPFSAVLVLPVLFAAGMCLVDTADGVLMNAAYGWSFAKPVRKVFYNLSITAISVVAALVIGTTELVGVLIDRAAITSGPVVWVSHINLDYAGYGIIVLFLAGWLVALAMWRYGHIEQRWSATVITPAATPVAPGKPRKASVRQRHGRVDSTSRQRPSRPLAEKRPPVFATGKDLSVSCSFPLARARGQLNTSDSSDSRSWMELQPDQPADHRAERQRLLRLRPASPTAARRAPMSALSNEEMILAEDEELHHAFATWPDLPAAWPTTMAASNKSGSTSVDRDPRQCFER